MIPNLASPVSGDQPWVLSAGIVAVSALIEDVILMGYSQGASRAEALARKWPKRYTRLVLIAAPTVASPRGLSTLRAAVATPGGSRMTATTVRVAARARRIGAH